MNWLDILSSYAKGTPAISPNLDYISQRMDDILKYVITNPLFTTLLDVFSQIGVVMLIVYFAIDLLDKASDVQFTVEILVRQFIKLIIGYAVMTHLSSLLIGLNTFVMALNNDVAAAVSSTGGGFWQEVAKNSNTTAINPSFYNPGATSEMLLLCGSQIILQILTWSISVERALKIGYKSILAPLACADMITNGMQSNGIRYIKSILATYLQSTVILLIMIVINSVCNTLTAKASVLGPVYAIIGLFVLWNTVKKSEEIADEII